jgi:DNA polymerase
MPARKAVLSTAAALIPEHPTLTQIRDIAAGCQACDLWQRGTQTIFGEGRPKAQIVFVGEQPGNDEDLAGKPFVGPAGKLLDKALEEAEIDRGLTYVTNVVKHFKWEPRGKRRIHAKPNAQEITACLPWLQAEIRLVQPELVVCLGSTAHSRCSAGHSVLRNSAASSWMRPSRRKRWRPYTRRRSSVLLMTSRGDSKPCAS